MSDHLAPLQVKDCEAQIVDRVLAWLNTNVSSIPTELQWVS